jgi:hypothetical protein
MKDFQATEKVYSTSKHELCSAFSAGPFCLSRSEPQHPIESRCRPDLDLKTLLLTKLFLTKLCSVSFPHSFLVKKVF